MKRKDKWNHVVGKDVQPNEDGGAWITYWFDDNTHEDIYSTDYEEIWGEPDPNPTGEYYDEWMPKYGGRQLDDDD